MSACTSLAAVPEPFSFVHDAKLAWNKKLPISWVEKDGAKVLKMEGGPDGGSGKVDLKCPEAFERFRSCIEKDDILKKAGIELHATFGSGALYVKDYRIEAAKDAFMDGIVEKAGAKIPEGYRCEYSKKWLDDCCNIFDAADDVDMWAYHSYGEYHGWNLEYEEETPYEGKPKKMPKGEGCSRMKVMKAHWAGKKTRSLGLQEAVRRIAASKVESL